MNCPAAGWARRMPAEALIDQAPDRSVVPGYANIDAPRVTYALTSAVVGVTAAAGARAVDPDSAWYRGLANRPGSRHPGPGRGTGMARSSRRSCASGSGA